MAEKILEVKNLQVNYLLNGENLTVIDNVNFSLEKGKILGIVGESGCGKSVTASSIMGLLPKGIGRVETGEIIFKGQDLTKLPEEEMRHIRGGEISMIFQNPMTALNPVYTIGKQIVEIIREHEKISRKNAWEKGITMLEKVGIPEPRQRMKEYPHQLSGGMRQRVVIAMALSTNPKIMIADEPTTALDVTIQAQVLDLIKKLQKDLDTACIFITHDMGVIAEIADYVMVMYAGKVVEYDTVEGFFKKPSHPYSCGLLRSIPRSDKEIERLYTIPGVVPALGEMPKGCRYQGRCLSCVDKCREQEPALKTMANGKKIACWVYPKDGRGEVNGRRTQTA